MMYCAMMHADKWNFYWYHLAYTADKPRALESENKAFYWQNKVRVSFVVAMASFLLAFSCAKTLRPRASIHGSIGTCVELQRR